MLHSKGLGTCRFSEASGLSLGPTQPPSIDTGDSFPQGQCGGLESVELFLRCVWHSDVVVFFTV